MKFLFTLIALLGALQAQQCNVCGFWFPEESHDSIVEIYEENGELKGRVHWMKYPNLSNGQPLLDSMNKKVELRTRSLEGLVFLYRFKKDGEKWENGKVYDSRSGKTYSAEISLSDEGQLKLTGYIGMSWLGKSVFWDRVKQ